MKKRRFTTAIPYKEFFIPYGNFDKSRKPIDRIIIHSIVGSVESAIRTFSRPGTKKSIHYIIGNDGRLYAGLEEYWTAWHAGNYPVNQRSIGIEHEWWFGMKISDKLYETSAKLVADICKFYNIPCDRKHILAHREVAATRCPNDIDVDRIVREAKKILDGNPDFYKGLDLNNKESMKAAVDIWNEVMIEKKWIKKEECIKLNRNTLKEVERWQNIAKERGEEVRKLDEKLRKLREDFDKMIAEKDKECQKKVAEKIALWKGKLRQCREEKKRLKEEYEKKLNSFYKLTIGDLLKLIYLRIKDIKLFQ